MSLTKASYSMIAGAPANVFDFGAVGDGVTDDTIAIKAAIVSVMQAGFGGQVYFPHGRYKVTSTINSVELCTAAGIDRPRGLQFVGEMGAKNTNPLSAENSQDMCIFAEGIPNTDPVFYFENGSDVSFYHIGVFGAKHRDIATKAFACVWIDGNAGNYRFSDCFFGVASIGIRIASSYNYTTTAWTPGVSAYTGFTVPASVAAGGFATDNFRAENCFFDGTSISSISIESAQSLDMVMGKCFFAPGTGKSIYITACQGLSVYDATITGETFIYLLPQASTSNIVSFNYHIENGASPAYVVDHGNFTAIGIACAIYGGSGGIVRLKGAVTTPQSTFTINNATLSGVELGHEGMSLIVNNAIIESFTKTTATVGNFLSLINVTVLTTLGANWNAFNKTVIESSTLPGLTELKNVPLVLNNALGTTSNLLLSRSIDTNALGMSGTSFYGTNTFMRILVGCYENSAGTLIASSTSGGMLSLLSATDKGFTYSAFSGATIGAAPVMVEVFNAYQDSGASIPQMTADAGPVGSMYYNTSTGRFRRRDAVGWANF